MIRKIVQLSIDPNLCNRTKYCVSEALTPTATTTDVPDADATARAEDGDCPQRGGIVTVVPCMRVGLLVEDLDEAIANFADQLGMPFSEPLAADNDSF
jgi:hypothetical protein